MASLEDLKRDAERTLSEIQTVQTQMNEVTLEVRNLQAIVENLTLETRRDAMEKMKKVLIDLRVDLATIEGVLIANQYLTQEELEALKPDVRKRLQATLSVDQLFPQMEPEKKDPQK